MNKHTKNVLSKKSYHKQINCIPRFTFLSVLNNFPFETVSLLPRTRILSRVILLCYFYLGLDQHWNKNTYKQLAYEQSRLK